MTGQLKQEKLNLSSNIDDLEALTEVWPLTMHEIDLKSQYTAKLAGLLREEELKWYQRSKAQFLLEGYFIVWLMVDTKIHSFIL
jgi:hypothetical protein